MTPRPGVAPGSLAARRRGAPRRDEAMTRDVAVALTLDYAGALAALEALEGRGMKLGLERIEALLGVLGNPHRGLRGALVAGHQRQGLGVRAARVDGARRRPAHGDAHQAAPAVVVRADRRRRAADRRAALRRPHRAACSTPPTRLPDDARLADGVRGASPPPASSPPARRSLTCSSARWASAAGSTAPTSSTSASPWSPGSPSTTPPSSATTSPGSPRRRRRSSSPATTSSPGRQGIALDGDPRSRGARGGGTRRVAVGTDVAWHGRGAGPRGASPSTSTTRRCTCPAPLIGGFQARNLAWPRTPRASLDTPRRDHPGRRHRARRRDRAAGRAACSGSTGSPALLIDGCHNAEAVAAMVAAAVRSARGTASSRCSAPWPTRRSTPCSPRCAR